MSLTQTASAGKAPIERPGRQLLPVGAEPLPDGTRFRVWAPEARRVEVALEGGAGAGPGGRFPLEAEPGGYFSATVEGVPAGAHYRYFLDGEGPFADPASRFQPEGPEGPSRIVDPAAFSWSDAGWPGVAPRGQVLYEMHVGTFTPEGTWAAAARELPRLGELGITVLELMPVADFPGEFGWGYDGVCPFAPTRLYGTPDDFRRFVDTAHRLGLGVVLDVVYNHLGPRGNVLPRFSPFYLSRRHETEWGQCLNFDDEGSEAVREYVAANAAYWISELHLDGLRLDATQDVADDSPEHILSEIARRVREAAGRRRVLLIAENEPQHGGLARPRSAGGFDFDMLWNDDFHHSAMVACTGRNEAYYSDYLGSPQELVSAARRGFLFQGQRYRWQGKRRGTPSLDLPPWTFVHYLQNHDQVANSGRGRRLHQNTSPGRWRAMTAYLLLAPGTPMLFQGQELAASTPFQYFADHGGELGRQVMEGRREFLAQFPRLAQPGAAERIADPGDRRTFEECKLDPREAEEHEEAVRLHRDLLRLRRGDPAFGQSAGSVDGAVLGPEAFVLRFFTRDGEDRLLLVNLGRSLQLPQVPEPLLAPPAAGLRWELLWSSEDPVYGGGGTPPVEREDGWQLPAQAAVVLRPAPEPGEANPPAFSGLS